MKLEWEKKYITYRTTIQMVSGSHLKPWNPKGGNFTFFKYKKKRTMNFNSCMWQKYSSEMKGK